MSFCPLRMNEMLTVLFFLPQNRSTYKHNPDNPCISGPETDKRNAVDHKVTQVEMIGEGLE